MAILEAVTLRRPESLVYNSLLGRRRVVVDFNLTDEEPNMSNVAYELYKQL